MKASKLEANIEAIKRDLSTPVSPHTLKKGAIMPKKVKAEAEAETKKGKKAEKSSKGGDKVTLADLAAEAKISGAAARRKIRATEIERGDGRWEWEPGSKTLRTVREALGLKAK